MSHPSAGKLSELFSKASAQIESVLRDLEHDCAATSRDCVPPETKLIDIDFQAPKPVTVIASAQRAEIAIGASGGEADVPWPIQNEVDLRVSKTSDLRFSGSCFGTSEFGRTDSSYEPRPTPVANRITNLRYSLTFHNTPPDEAPGRKTRAFGKTGFRTSILSKRLGRNSLAEKAENRIRSRLGSSDVIDAEQLFETVSCLGYFQVTREEVNMFLEKLADKINLRFDGNYDYLDIFRALSSRLEDDSLPVPHQPFQWEWPTDEQIVEPEKRVCRRKRSAEFKLLVPVQALQRALIENDDKLRKMFGTQTSATITAIKDVLLAGDTNQLLADLTHVRIDDIAGSKGSRDRGLTAEAIALFMVILHGIALGVQTNDYPDPWPGWIFIAGIFNLFFIVEVSLRCWSVGLPKFFCWGKWWNIFDAVTCLVGIGDIIFELLTSTPIAMFDALIRALRFVRVARILHVLKWKRTIELELLMKGFLGGVRALFWGFVVLASGLFIIGVVATMTLGRDERTNIDEMFSSIDESMFTAFRCLGGDCLTSKGQPLEVILYRIVGYPFLFGYLVSYIAISLGVFNVILALYVEITMHAARRREENCKIRHAQESVRIANITKKLMSLFCAAESEYRRMSMEEQERFSVKQLDDVKCLDTNSTLGKDLFLVLIQDPIVRKLLDDLDVPSNRADLFDMIDATDSGSLKVTELVRGLLKVRGEFKKSDYIGIVFSLKVVQNTLLQTKDQLEKQQESIAKFADEFQVSKQ